MDSFIAELCPCPYHVLLSVLISLLVWLPVLMGADDNAHEVLAKAWTPNAILFLRASSFAALMLPVKATIGAILDVCEVAYRRYNTGHMDASGRELMVTMPVVAIEACLLSVSCASVPMVGLLLSQSANNWGLMYACGERFQWALGVGTFLSVLHRNDPAFWTLHVTIALIVTSGAGHVIGAFSAAHTNASLGWCSTVLVFASTGLLVVGNAYRCIKEGLRLCRARHANAVPAKSTHSHAPTSSNPRNPVASVVSGGESVDAVAAAAAVEEEQPLLAIGSNALVLFNAIVIAAVQIVAAKEVQKTPCIVEAMQQPSRGLFAHSRPCVSFASPPCRPAPATAAAWWRPISG